MATNSARVSTAVRSPRSQRTNCEDGGKKHLGMVYCVAKSLMSTTSVKVSAKYQIVIPQTARRKLNIKKGDRLLVDVQDGVIVLTPEPKHYSAYLQGLRGEIWKGVDVQKYLDGERDAWANSTNG